MTSSLHNQPPAALEIPAGHVRVTRRTNRYLRSRNGAWYGSVPATEDIRILPEAEAAAYVNGEFVTVEWPDGYYEFFDCAVTPMRFSHVGTREQCKTETVSLTAGLQEPLTYERPLSRLGRVGYYRLEAA